MTGNRLAACLVLALCFAALAPAPAQTLGVVLTGQSLIKQDLRDFAPDAVAQARGYLGGADAVFTNLEVALAPADAPLTPRNPRFVRVDPVVLDTLGEMGFNLLALSNNHAFDLGAAGIFATIEEVERRGFAHAGTGTDEQAAAAAGLLTTANGRVGLIGVAAGGVQLTPDTWAADGKPGVNFLHLNDEGRLDPDHRARLLGAVRAAGASADLLIVYLHNHYWGEPRGSGLPPGRERRIDRFQTPGWMEALARELIEAGADVFVAHGNPALHGIEIHHGRPIFYGLGNYIFQAVATPDRYGPLAYQSVVARIAFHDGRLAAIDLQPLVLALDQGPIGPRGTPYLAEGAEAHGVLRWLADRSAAYGTHLLIDGDQATVVLPDR